jgi:hypothetical protein
LEFLCCDVLGLEPDVGIAPRTREHDGGTDPSQFRREALAIYRLVAPLPLGALGPAPETDRVVGSLAAGHVDLIDPWMSGEAGTHLCPTVREPDEPPPHQIVEYLLEDGPKVVIHRVHFQDADLAFDVELVEKIQRGDGGDVSGPEHQCHLPFGGGLPVEPRHVGVEVAGGDLPLHPHLGSHAAEEQSVMEIRRKDLHHELPIRAHSHRTGLQIRNPPPRQGLHCSLKCVDPVEESIRSRKPLFSSPWRTRGDPLRVHRGFHPAVGHLSGTTTQTVQEPDFPGNREPCPRILPLAKYLDGLVDRFRGQASSAFSNSQVFPYQHYPRIYGEPL